MAKVILTDNENSVGSREYRFHCASWGADSIAFFYEAARVIGTNGTSLDTFRTLSDSLDRSEKEDDYEQNHI